MGGKSLLGATYLLGIGLHKAGSMYMCTQCISPRHLALGAGSKSYAFNVKAALFGRVGL
jgi:hypothetical protein